MERTGIAVAERCVRVIVFQRIGMCMEWRRSLVCTVIIFVGRYGHCGDRMVEGSVQSRNGCRASGSPLDYKRMAKNARL